MLFTLLDGNGTVLREGSVDIRVCAPTQLDTPFNSCFGNSRHFTNAACPTSNTQTRQGDTKHHRVHRLKEQHYKWQQQQSGKFLAQDDQIEDDLRTEGGMM